MSNSKMSNSKITYHCEVAPYSAGSLVPPSTKTNVSSTPHDLFATSPIQIHHCRFPIAHINESSTKTSAQLPNPHFACNSLCHTVSLLNCFTLPTKSQGRRSIARSEHRPPSPTQPSYWTGVPDCPASFALLSSGVAG